jgi:putative tryptophan/tyrosine transport system substrate-binding protein
MRRRDFIMLLGGAAATWPLAARAQQAMPVIGLIGAGFPELAGYAVTAFRQRLNHNGYVEGQNVTVEYRWARNKHDLMRDLVADLLRRGVTVIATPGNPTGTIAAKAATATVPIVFAVAADPVKLGLVASIARPGGNLTGMNFLNAEITMKRLGLLRELVPGTARVTVLANPSNALNAETQVRDAEVAAHSMGMHVRVINASTSSEINEAFASFGRERPDALFVTGDSFFNGRRVQLVNLASRHALPAVYADRILTEAGGLTSYGTDIRDHWRHVGVYVGRILKGAKPADLPVVQSTKIELIINAETARMLGLSIPPSLLALADEVIE